VLANIAHSRFENEMKTPTLRELENFAVQSLDENALILDISTLVGTMSQYRVYTNNYFSTEGV